MEKLIEKINEFILCCQHLHMRGMGDTKQEMILIISELKKEGKTFEDFKRFMMSKGAPEEMFETDKISLMVKEAFESSDLDRGISKGE